MPALLKMKSVLLIIDVDGLFCNLEGNSVSKAGLKVKDDYEKTNYATIVTNSEWLE